MNCIKTINQEMFLTTKDKNTTLQALIFYHLKYKSI